MSEKSEDYDKLAFDWVSLKEEAKVKKVHKNMENTSREVPSDFDWVALSREVAVRNADGQIQGYHSDSELNGWSKVKKNLIEYPLVTFGFAMTVISFCFIPIGQARQNAWLMQYGGRGRVAFQGFTVLAMVATAYQKSYNDRQKALEMSSEEENK